jgi:hypothetical protein
MQHVFVAADVCESMQLRSNFVQCGFCSMHVLFSTAGTHHAHATAVAERCGCPVHRCCRPKSTGLAAESSFGAMAVEADTMEDKLQLVQTKRR